MLVVVFQLLLTACASLAMDPVAKRPGSAVEADMNLVSYHRRVATEVVEKLNSQNLLYEDSEARLIVDQILARLITPAARASINVVFTRLPGENALALANGTILIHQSLLATVASEPQLAFLLAHEISHLNLNHAWSTSRSSLQERFDRHAFGREQEIEADQYAARILAQAGYDLVEASEFFTQLANYPVAFPGSEQARTHPLLAERKQTLLNTRQVTLTANYSEDTDLGTDHELQRRFDRFRIRQLLRSIQSKTKEPDLPGALLQLSQLEAIAGSGDETECLRANIYVAIGADFTEARNAMRELLGEELATGSVGRHDGGLKPNDQASGFFQDQAEDLYRNILAQSPDANCASRGLSALLAQR